MTKPEAGADRKPRHPLDALATRMLDQWARWRETDEASVGRPRSSWDGIKLAHAKREGAAKYRSRNRTVYAVETRPSGRSIVPPGVDERRAFQGQMLVVDQMMTLVAEIHPEYARAVYACHVEQSERRAAALVGIPRSELRTRYAAGYALFLRELSGHPRCTD